MTISVHGSVTSYYYNSGMDTWTKTMVAIKVLTAFKKRRKKKLEAEQKEKIAKEKRKNLWRRLGFKLRSQSQPSNAL